MSAPITLKRDTTVTGAEQVDGYRSGAWDVIVEDYSSETVWLYENENHARFVVVARSFESALEAVYDELPTVPEDELHEAYGFDTAEEFRAECDRLEAEGDNPPDLAECHYYQANFTGTGIVFPGYSEALHEFTRDDAKRIRLIIARVE